MNEQIEQLIEATIEEHIDEMLGDGGFTKESLELTIKKELANISVAERDIGKQVENVEKVLYLKALSGELGAIKLFLERHAKESEVVGEYKVVKYVIGKPEQVAKQVVPSLASSAKQGVSSSASQDVKHLDLGVSSSTKQAQPKENVNILTNNDADTSKSI